MAAPVEAILFDVGGVFTLSPFHAIETLGEQMGARPGQLHDIVFGEYGQDGAHPWHRLERGEISLGQARDDILALGRQHDLDVDLYQLLAALPRDGGAHVAVPLVEQVRYYRRTGFRTGIITNNVREFRDGWRSLFPVDELFEFVVDSCEVGVRKPDARIFQLALGHLGDVPAEACVFLDDHPANVATEASMCMRTVLVGTDMQQTIRELAQLVEAH